MDRERVRRRVRRPVAAVGAPGRPVRPPPHVLCGLGPVRRRHPAGSRSPGPGAALGWPRRPRRRRSRTQSCSDVTAHPDLSRWSASQGHEHLGRRLDAGRCYRCRARGTARRLPGMAVGVPRHRAGVRGRYRPGPSRPTRECRRSSAPVRLARFGGQHRSGRRPGARRRVRRGAGMDGPTGRREPGRRCGADDDLRDGRASGR